MSMLDSTFRRGWPLTPRHDASWKLTTLARLTQAWRAFTGRSVCLLIFAAVLLTACGGNSSSAGDAPGGDTPKSTTITISGTASYDFVPAHSNGIGLNYNAITRKPIRGATVQLLDRFGNVLSATTTNSQGAYTFNTTSHQTIRVRVRAELRDTVSPGTYNVKVLDNTAGDALYVLDSPQFTPTASETRDLHADSGWGGFGYTGTRSAAPFAVLDVAYQALHKVQSVAPSVNLPALQIFWSANNNPSYGDPSNGQIGTSYFTYANNTNSLYLLGAEDTDTDEYDTHLIAHEIGHYLQHVLSTDDSIGGPHTDGDLLDMRVALSEGWGNGWAGIVMDDPAYTDTSGSAQSSGFTFDVSEAPDNDEAGFFSESTAQYLVWSLNADPDIGFEPIYDALAALKNSPQFTSLYSFGMALKNVGVDSATVDALWAGQSIHLEDEYGTGETNFGDATPVGAVARAKPVYHSYETFGAPQQYCIDNETAGEYNKLGNSVFVSFTTMTAGEHTLTLEADTPNGDTDPDFEVVTSSGERHEGYSGVEDTETKTIFFPAGKHAVALSDYELTSSCFNFMVSN